MNSPLKRGASKRRFLVREINPCRYCKRKAELVERAGGWTVDCYYSSPLVAALDAEAWCEEGVDWGGKMYPTADEAIDAWNAANPMPEPHD